MYGVPLCCVLNLMCSSCLDNGHVFFLRQDTEGEIGIEHFNVFLWKPI